MNVGDKVRNIRSGRTSTIRQITATEIWVGGIMGPSPRANYELVTEDEPRTNEPVICSRGIYYPGTPS